jgi:hypothetical protein
MLADRADIRSRRGDGRRVDQSRPRRRAIGEADQGADFGVASKGYRNAAAAMDQAGEAQKYREADTDREAVRRVARPQTGC